MHASQWMQSYHYRALKLESIIQYTLRLLFPCSLPLSPTLPIPDSPPDHLKQPPT